MGHKAVVILDLDVIENIIVDPTLFASRLRAAAFEQSRTRLPSVSVNIGGATVARVVHKCHVDEMPLIAVNGMDAVLLNTDVTGMSVRIKAPRA